MKLNPEEFLYLLAQLGINLLKPINAKIIKIHYLTQIEILTEPTNPEFLEKMHNLLKTLNFQITSETDKIILDILTTIIKSKQFKKNVRKRIY